MKLILAFLLCLAIPLGGCTITDPVKTANSAYYVTNAKVTALDAGVLKVINDCTSGAAPAEACTPANKQRLAQATTALGQAMDGYSAALHDPNFNQGNVNRALAAVNAAIPVLETLLAEFGAH